MAKAKKKDAAKKRAKTILESVRAEANNYQALAEQQQTLAMGAEMKLAEVSKELAETKGRLSSRFEEGMRMRSDINSLKLTISELEKSDAEKAGVIRTLERQIDQAAPKVEVIPAVMVSPSEARAMRSPRITTEGLDTHELRRALEGGTRAKHWTSL